MHFESAEYYYSLESYFFGAAAEVLLVSTSPLLVPVLMLVTSR